MAVNLEKGQKIDLVKKDGGGLNEIMVGLGWDQAGKVGGLFGSKSVDCDSAIILCGSNEKIISTKPNECCIYFGNLHNENSSIVHQGDNLTGKGEGDDENIMISLSTVPTNVEKLVFTVNIYGGTKRKQHFGLIKNAYIRVVDLSSKEEICKFNLTENYNGKTGLIVGEIYRRNDAWKFNAVGQGVEEASSLNDLLKMYA